MTLVELLDALQLCDLYQDGEDLYIESPHDLTREEVAGLRAHKPILLRILPRAPAHAPPKIPGEGGNVL
jgi:hypothetical protein